MCAIAGPLSAPRNRQLLSITNSEASSLSWSPPESDGGARLNRYSLERRVNGSERWTRVDSVPAECLTHTARNLMEDSRYEFRVAAENAIGVGPTSESTARSVARLPYSRPERPAAPQARPSSKSEVAVAWEAPADGGAPIVAYVLEMRVRASPPSPARSPFLVVRLLAAAFGAQLHLHLAGEGKFDLAAGGAGQSQRRCDFDCSDRHKLRGGRPARHSRLRVPCGGAESRRRERLLSGQCAGAPSGGDRWECHLRF